MDNHPIPQDVTNFQFKLIGDMTLKQFGYVAGGVILGWTILASPLPFFIKFLLAAGLVLAGVVLAFVPVEGRPSDVMVIHFMKALFSPTQFIYQKTAPASASPQTVTTSTPPIQQEKKNNEPQPSEKIQLQSLQQVASAAVKAKQEEEPITAPLQQQLPDQSAQTPMQQETVLQQEVTQLTQALAAAKTQEAHVPTNTEVPTEAHEKVIDLEKELQDVLLQKQQLEKQLLELQKTLAEKKGNIFTPSTAMEPAKETQHVKQVPQKMQAGVGVPLVPESPNLITGVIKDSRNNLLQNILIEVKDKDGNPVRAFKTNALGQFAAATPLLNGTYTISFEDTSGKHSFDSVEIVADGNIILPMEIISVDARERLRQELFGTS